MRPAADLADACLVRLARFLIGVDSDVGPLFLMMLNYTCLARTIPWPLNPFRKVLPGCLMMMMLVVVSARGESSEGKRTIMAGVNLRHIVLSTRPVCGLYGDNAGCIDKTSGRTKGARESEVAKRPNLPTRGKSKTWAEMPHGSQVCGVVYERKRWFELKHRDATQTIGCLNHRCSASLFKTHAHTHWFVWHGI